MKKILLYTTTVFLVSLMFIQFACKKKSEETPKNSDVWDIDKDGIPKFVGFDYIDLSNIYRISKFRSAVGHDYSDAFEHCRSMKHYYEPKSSIDWSTLKIYSPISGSITRVDQEWAGTKLEIASDAYPAFRFSIFHILTLKNFSIGDKVVEGEQLGTHIGSQTLSDIAVIVNDPTHQGRMISFFDVMKDDVFNNYINRGIDSRDDMIISKAVRDLNPLTCNGDTFVGNDTLVNWVNLN